MLKDQIKNQIKHILEKAGVTDVEPAVEYPADPKHGDYSTNVAMVAAKKVGKNPREFAEELKNKLQEKEIFEKVEIAGPGFINFFVKDDVLVKEVRREKGERRSEKGVFAGKKIMVEYTDPNPFKELHIGHLYSNVIGESLCNIFEAAGATVCRVDYFGDVGMHVAKSLWGLEQKLQQVNSPYATIEQLAEAPLHDRIKFLGEGYALGANAYAEDTDAAEVIRMINKHIYIAAQEMWHEEKGIEPAVDYQQGQHIDPATLQHIKELYTLGRKWSLEYFETLYKRLGTKFDKYYPESIAGEWGYKLVKKNIDNGIFVESEGAVIFPGELHGLHNRVFINKLGLPTYEAKELGLMPWKYEEFPYDLSFIVTATEIAGYFSVLKKAMMEVSPELGEKTTPILHGMVKLPEGKMSSRSGNVITVNSLLDDAKAQVISRVGEEIANREEVAEMIGVAAVKYAFLKSSIGKDIVFDFDESVSFDGNSGPYLQYTFARTQSVLRRSEKGEVKREKFERIGFSLAIEERELLRLLVRFDEIVEEAAVRYAPNAIANYLFELAQAFNLFYQKHPILKGDPTVIEFRIELTEATGQTLKKGLHLLGIKTPERM